MHKQILNMHYAFFLSFTKILVRISMVKSTKFQHRNEETLVHSVGIGKKQIRRHLLISMKWEFGGFVFLYTLHSVPNVFLILPVCVPGITN